MSDTVQQNDEFWMSQALLLAEQAEQQGEIPVGAVVVVDQQCIGKGFNQSITLNDPSAHAEMQAIRAAGQQLRNYRMPGATLYVTLEPCPMCAGLLVHSRIERLVFGAFDQKTGSAGSVMNLVENDELNHQLSVLGGVLEARCSEQLSAFFRRRRAEHKARKSANRSDR